jgi:hypothetical protein
LEQGTREREEADAALRANEAPRRAEADRLAKAEAPTEPVAGVTPAAPPAAQALGRADLAPSDVPELRSLDPGVRWRLAEPGIVERSTNGGASWERLDTGVRIPFRAGACPSASACWIIGDAGVVLLTTDAKTWRRLTSPSPEDLVAVDAADATAAVVRAASGLRFRTLDGGGTWTRVP